MEIKEIIIDELKDNRKNIIVLGEDVQIQKMMKTLMTESEFKEKMIEFISSNETLKSVVLDTVEKVEEFKIELRKLEEPPEIKELIRSKRWSRKQKQYFGKYR